MKKNIFLIIIFAFILVLPTLDSFFNVSPVKDIFEKRLPQEKPKFSFSTEYPKNFDKYFNDNYGFRKSLIYLNSKIMDMIFDESPDERAVIGKDEWLYFDNYNSLLDAMGRAVLSDKLVELGVDAFYRNWQKMRAKNIDYLLVIAADKSTVYPEFLPDYIEPKGPHRIDKFLAALKKKYPDFPVLDLRPIMLEAKKNEIIYHQTDTHWNKRGAHYAYVEIAKKLGLKPHLRNEYKNRDDQITRGDISDIMGSDASNIDYDLEPKFGVNYHHVWPISEEVKKFHNPAVYLHNNKSLPLLFVYKDSFFGNIVNFTSEHFSKSIYINEFPCDINYEIIKNFHPNVVIQEFWEGRIEAVLSECKI